MSARPVLHVTNWPSKTLHGPGRPWSIMLWPQDFERGAGHVRAFTPRYDEGDLLSAALEGRGMQLFGGGAAMDTYRGALDTRWAEDLAAGRLAPGALEAEIRHGLERFVKGGPVVASGDSLLCRCAKGAPCHRRWLCPYLVHAGWDVLLDGEPFTLSGASA